MHDAGAGGCVVTTRDSARSMKGRSCATAPGPILFSISCISYIPPPSREVGSASLPFQVIAGRMRNMLILPFLIWHGQLRYCRCVSWSLASRCYWTYSVMISVTWADLGWQARRKLLTTRKNAHTHARSLARAHRRAWLSEILVAQQGGCGESWSVVVCLQKCQQVKAQTALKAHAWSGFLRWWWWWSGGNTPSPTWRRWMWVGWIKSNLFGAALQSVQTPSDKMRLLGGKEDAWSRSYREI